MRPGPIDSFSSAGKRLACCALAALAACAGIARGADLLEIYRQAQAADTQYAAARASWAAAQEKLPQGLSGLLPSASVGVTLQNSERDTRSATTGTVVPG